MGHYDDARDRQEERDAKRNREMQVERFKTLLSETPESDMMVLIERIAILRRECDTSEMVATKKQHQALGALFDMIKNLQYGVR